MKKVSDLEDAWLMQNEMVSYEKGGDTIRFGPGGHENSYVQVRGALDKLSGPSVYITDFTPFEQRIRFECG